MASREDEHPAALAAPGRIFKRSGTVCSTSEVEAGRIKTLSPRSEQSGRALTPAPSSAPLRRTGASVVVGGLILGAVACGGSDEGGEGKGGSAGSAGSATAPMVPPMPPPMIAPGGYNGGGTGSGGKASGGSTSGEGGLASPMIPPEGGASSEDGGSGGAGGLIPPMIPPMPPPMPAP
jgi:hypothetical protein